VNTMRRDTDVTLKATRTPSLGRKTRGVGWHGPCSTFGVMTPSRHRLLGLVALAITSLSFAIGCTSSADCHHSCPISSFALDVPADRVDDVASVTPTGPCTPESVTGSAPGLYFFSVTGNGVCQIMVSFQSGAPDFVASVSIVPNPGPCCVGQPTAQETDISVPELGTVDASSGN
jgi:hypothetical protein